MAYSPVRKMEAILRKDERGNDISLTAYLHLQAAGRIYWKDS